MKTIAERKLRCVEKRTGIESVVLVRVQEPSIVDASDVNFSTDGVIASCEVRFEGIDLKNRVYYGVDSIQAVNLATDLDAVIEPYCDNYDFFWETGRTVF